MRTIYKLSTHLFLAFARDEWNGLKVNVDKIRSLRNVSRNVKTWKRFWSPMLAVKTPLKKTVQQYCLRLTKLKTRVLFNRRFSGEKSPTITVASFFFVRLFTHRVCTTFCELFTFTKSTQYLILNASKGLYLKMQNANPRRVPLPIFRRYETFPAPFSAL